MWDLFQGQKMSQWKLGKLGWDSLEFLEREVSRYDVCIRGGRGGHGKSDIVRDDACILYYKSVPIADKGGRGLKNQKFCRCHLWMLPKSAAK